MVTLTGGSKISEEGLDAASGGNEMKESWAVVVNSHKQASGTVRY